VEVEELFSINCVEV